MIWQVGEAGTNQAKERISGEMLASLRGNDRHGNPRLENLKSFQGEGYCRIDVYEKATGISRWLLGFVALRELLGRKQRIVPLMANTVDLVRGYLTEHRLDRSECSDVPLFSNRHGGRLSRSGIRYILAKYVASARGPQPSSFQHVSPHTFRHTKAMNLLQAGAPLVVIRDILGHADLKSTEIYAKADLEMKRQALANASNQSPTLQVPSWQQNKTLMGWLQSL